MPRFVPAVCPGCGAGCGLYLECREDSLVLTAPSRNDAVSEGRLCVRGWQMGDMVRNSMRLASPLLNGSAAGWDDAIAKASELLRPHLDASESRLGIVAASHLTNEEGFAITQFARRVLGTGNIDNFGRSVDGPSIWGLQHEFGHAHTQPPLRELVNYDVIVCLSSNLGYLNAQACSWVTRAQQMGATLAVIDQIDDGLGTAADIFVQHTPAAGSAVLQHLAKTLDATDESNGADELRRLGADSLAESFQELVEVLKGGSRVAIVLSTRAFSTPFAGVTTASLAKQLNRLQDVSADVFAVNGTPNSVGLGHMGVVPYFTGNSVEQRTSPDEGCGCCEGNGVGLYEMLDLNQRRLDGLIVIGEDLMSWLDRDGLDELREVLDVLIVLDSFRTAVTRVADVTLPVSGFGERDGSFSSLDGQVRWSGQIVEPYGESVYLPRVLGELAESLGRARGPQTVDEIWEQICAQVPGYACVDVSRLRSAEDVALDVGSLPANCYDELEVQEYFTPIEVADPEEWRYELLWRFDAHWWIYDGRMWSLPLLYREMRDWRSSHVLMNADDMERERLRPGRLMTLISAKGRAEVHVYPHQNSPPGLVVLPAHQRQLMETLLGPGRYNRCTGGLAYRCTPARVRQD